MVIMVSGIINLSDLIIKATDLLLRLPNKWYKGTLEIESFKSSLSILRQRTAQWNRQLNQFGMSEDPGLRTLLNHAATLLDEEDDYYEKHRKSRLWKLRRRLFPGKLTYILAEVRNIVEAGPGLLATSVETHELLTKRLLMSPSPLPFGYDRKYVPLPGAVEEVQRALDDPEGPRVVTLYGEPGIGKSSLAKYIALLYQEFIRGSGPSSFDGVQYLFCGQGSRSRIHLLQKEFLSNRGVAVTESAAIEGQDGDNKLFQNTLRRLLVDQKLLIILDDVWKEDFEVLVNLICPGNGIRYLVTSQSRRIWPDALKIEVSKPDDEHALQILINHTEGLSFHGQKQSLCTILETEIREVTEKLENHPLSLVNVAVSMNRNEAADPNQWKVLAQNLYTHLDQNHYTGSILVYERPYSLSVSSSMMLMVESLRTTEREVLFLVAMLRARHEIPEALIKYFFRRLYHNNPSHAQLTYKYFSGVKYLEDNSLLQVHKYRKGPILGNSVDINRSCVKIHHLRRQYISYKHLPALQYMASTILGTQSYQERRHANVNVRDSDQCFATMLSTLYFDDSLVDEVALPFQCVMTHLSGGAIPRGLEQEIDAHELVKRTKDTWSSRSYRFGRMVIVAVELLNLQGNEGWKQTVRTDITKMMMKLVCQKELEDESMASLLMTPQTTAVACEIFDCIYAAMHHENLKHLFYSGQRKSLSDTHPRTWRALSSLWYKNLWYKNLIYFEIASKILQWMLEFEPHRTVLAEVQKMRQLADQSPDPLLQKVVEDGFLRLHDSRLTCQMLSGSDLEYLPIILWRVIDDPNFVQSDWRRKSRELKINEYSLELERRYQNAVECVYRDTGYVQTLLKFPVPCDKWLTDAFLFKRLIRLEQRFRPWSLLGLLSGTPEFGAKVADILKEECWEEDFTLWPESYDGRLAHFWGNMALVRDLHQTTRQRLVKIAQRWIVKLAKEGESVCFCTCSCSKKGCGCRPKCNPVDPESTLYECDYCGDGWGVPEVTRAVTIINHLHAKSSFILPALGDPPRNCLTGLRQNSLVHMGQAQAYDQMGMYAEAIRSLQSAQHALDRVSAASSPLSSGDLWPFYKVARDLRSHMILMKALSKDYPGCMELIGDGLEDLEAVTHPSQFWELGDRAVLFRLSAEFPKAIQNFDRSLDWCGHNNSTLFVRCDPRLLHFIKYRLLRHRGYAKYLMGDHGGSTMDATSAQKLKESALMVEPASWEYLSYGFSFFPEPNLKYSLLQLPTDDPDSFSILDFCNPLHENLSDIL